MTTELINKTTGEIVEQKGFTDEQIQLLKSTVCKDHTNEEFAVFLNVCKRVQLDPFAKQIYSIKYNGRMTTQTSIDGLRLIADRTGRYAPGRASTFTYDKEGKLESATAYVMKNVGGQWFEVGATAILSEYINNYNALWKKLPHAMLSKCAESQALRKSFAQETSGLLTHEEMDQANETKPTIQMPRARTETISYTTNPIPPVDGIPERMSGNSEDSVEDNTDNGLESEIEFGEPQSEKKKIEEKINKAFGKGSKLISDKQRAMLFARTKKAKIPEEVLRAYLKDHFSVESTSELTMGQMDEILKWIERFEKLNEGSN